ncbi:conserved hypothetical protein [Flavobacterium sp. 9AF]|uniref:glycosyltransferase family 4 protein n=1 Tax=Flavobacterium sp. 9AF TaxID=2653142 RepID=UPI0012F04AB2|nr:glycosyltransferase family 4 protein [Flavobacterium sp. 9AF]VXC31580.1 conserved hypothetical protein [Flavobacterium sp. 9AF]
MKSKKIAIYSGEIPSTTFIERLIMGLAESNNKIYLFGKQNKKIDYPKKVKLITYSNKISKAILLFKYTVLVTIFKNKDKKKLDQYIQLQPNNIRIKKIKYYPVLWHSPDIFHLQWAKGIEDWMWVQEFGIKLVLSLRGAHINYSPITFPKFKDIYISCFPKIDGFHAVSNAISKQSLSYKADEKKIRTIYSGLNLDNLKYEAKEFEDLTKNLSIVSIGRTHWVKGYNYALDGMKHLDSKNISFNYTIVGINNEEEILFQRNQLNLESKIFFKNQLPFQEVLELIRKAHIILLPSVEEGIANVVLEAMALGTLVVSTDCGGMQEVVKDGENGFVVPVRDAQAIAQAILRARDLTLKEYNEMTKNARLIIERQHATEKMIGDFNSFYNIILNKELS